MKKFKLGLFIVTLFIVGSYLIQFPLYSKHQSKQYNYLNDDVIMISNSQGFNSEQKQKIATLAGVEDSLYMTDYTTSLKKLGNEKNQIVQFRIDQLPPDITQYVDFKLTDGQIFNQKNQLLVSQSLADVLVEYGFIDEEVIGSKLNLDQVFTITGIYPDPADLTIEVTTDNEGNLDNQNQQPVTVIKVSGIGAISSNYTPLDTQTGIKYYNFEIATNEQNRDNQSLQYAMSSGEYDWDLWEKIGAIGLLDTDLDYGPTFDTYGLIQIDDASNATNIQRQIEANYNHVTTVTNQTKIFDLDNFSQLYLLQVLIGIIIIGLVILPNRKSRK